jgi:Mn2+/Fe2+ NRAMP family transporter
MWTLVNSRLVAAGAVACAGVIVFLNIVLLWQTFGLPLPFRLGA